MAHLSSVVPASTAAITATVQNLAVVAGFIASMPVVAPFDPDVSKA